MTVRNVMCSMFYIYIYYLSVINVYLHSVWTHCIDWQNIARRLRYLLLDVKSRTSNKGEKSRTRKRNSKLCLLFQVGRFVLVVKLWWHIIKSIDYGFHYWHIYNDNEIKKKGQPMLTVLECNCISSVHLQ